MICSNICLNGDIWSVAPLSITIRTSLVSMSDGGDGVGRFCVCAMLVNATGFVVGRKSPALGSKFFVLRQSAGVDRIE